jgi:hypothetical protein
MAEVQDNEKNKKDMSALDEAIYEHLKKQHDVAMDYDSELYASKEQFEKVFRNQCLVALRQHKGDEEAVIKELEYLRKSSILIANRFEKEQYESLTLKQKEEYNKQQIEKFQGLRKEYEERKRICELNGDNIGFNKTAEELNALSKASEKVKENMVAVKKEAESNWQKLFEQGDHIEKTRMWRSKATNLTDEKESLIKKRQEALDQGDIASIEEFGKKLEEVQKELDKLPKSIKESIEKDRSGKKGHQDRDIADNNLGLKDEWFNDQLGLAQELKNAASDLRDSASEQRKGMEDYLDTLSADEALKFTTTDEYKNTMKSIESLESEADSKEAESKSLQLSTLQNMAKSGVMAADREVSGKEYSKSLQDRRQEGINLKNEAETAEKALKNFTGDRNSEAYKRLSMDAMVAADKAREWDNKSDEEKGLTGNKLVDGVNKAFDDVNNKLGKTFKNGATMLSDGIKAGLAGFENALNTYFNLVSGGHSTRLWGTDTYYQEALKNIKYGVGLSPWLKQEKVIEKLNGLIEKGIVYNLEERAFLASISDKIAATFDAFDSNLMQIIRLQQADTTKARMGLESELNKFLGDYFQDSSYMNTGGASDQVSAALIEAGALMTREMSLEFEYTVQKWLGALHSLGLNENTTKTIASGLNMLSTGNVNGLSGNEKLTSLLAMSASQAGLSYSEMLLNGLDAETTNRLLESMVKYLKSIAEGDSNLVVKSQYSDIFGLNIADMRALSNLTEKDITKISSMNKTYQEMVLETYEMAASAMIRSNPAEMVKNLRDNLFWSMGETIGSNPLTALTYIVNKEVQNLTGGINIPFINAMGFGLDMNTDVNSLINLGLMGMSLLGTIGPAISGMSNIFGLAGPLAMFDAFSEEYTSRGKGFEGVLSGKSSGTSFSANVGNSSTDDMETKTLSDATDDSEEIKNTAGKSAKEHEDDRTSEDVYQMLFEERTTPVKVELAETEEIMKVRLQECDVSPLEVMSLFFGSKYPTLLQSMQKYYDVVSSTTADNIVDKAALKELLDTVHDVKVTNSGIADAIPITSGFDRPNF